MTLTDCKIVLMPIDTVVRELEWQLVMAAKLADKGFVSIIGFNTAINRLHRKSENCIWLGRLPNAGFQTGKHYKVLEDGEKNNTTFYYLDDEGGLYSTSNYDEALKRRHPYKRESLMSFEKILTWGEYQKKKLTEFGGTDGEKFLVTGMPRFDLYKPEFKWLTNLTNNFSHHSNEFILITTKFGNANSSVSTWHERIDKNLSGKPLIENIEPLLFWEKDMKLFAEFISMIAEICGKNQDYSFVIRPHPAEDMNFYKSIFSDFKNVTVTREGPVSEWIRNSKMIIHTGCTTGIEGVIAGKPVINYLPECAIVKYSGDIAIANEAGKIVFRREDVNKEIQKVLNDSFELSDMKFTKESMDKLYNLTNESFTKIEKLITSSNISNSKLNIPPEIYTNWKLQRERASLLKKDHDNKKELHKITKKPDLNKEYIRRLLAEFNANYKKDVKLRLVRKNFCIVSPK